MLRDPSSPIINHPDTEHSTGPMCATDRIATCNFRNKSILVCGTSRSWHQNYKPTASLLLLIFPSVPSQLHPSVHHGDAPPGNPTCCRFTKVPVNTRWEPRTQYCRPSNMRLVTLLRRGSAKLQRDEIPRITVMSLCSLPVNIAVALDTQIAGWLCSIEQTGIVMCVLRRDEYLYIYIYLCLMCAELCGSTKSNTFGTAKTAPCHKPTALQMLIVKQTMGLSRKKCQFKKCLAMFLTSHHGGLALNIKHDAHPICVQLI
jgi:hypothetical protein